LFKAIVLKWVHLRMDPFIILFDGVCNLCNGFVRFVIKQDAKAKFKFCSLQSETAKSILSGYNLNPEGLNSVVLIAQGKAYSKSDAALKILQHLGGFWLLTAVFFIIPRFFRNALYNFVAQNRYRWFGKSANCTLPNQDLQNRFLLD